MHRLQHNLNERRIAYTYQELIRDLLSFLCPYRFRFVFATLLRLSADIVWLYPTYAFASAVTFLSHYEKGASLSPLWFLLVASFSAYVYRAIATFFAKKIAFYLSERVALDVKVKTSQHLFLLDVSWHEKENTGNKLKRIDNGAAAINRLFRIWITNFIQIGVNFVGMTLILARFEYALSLMILFFIAIFLFLSNVIMKKSGLAAG